MNPREVQKAMKKLGISNQDIDAEQVIIRTPNKDIIIKNPQVSLMNMMNQKSFQITGDIMEIERDEIPDANEEDISTIMEQAKCTREEAMQSLKENNGNPAEAILKLQKG